MNKTYVYKSLGELGPPWTSMSQASMAKVMKAILITESRLLSSFIMDLKSSPRTSVLYTLEIPENKVDEFENICGYKLDNLPDIQIGMEIIKSAKKIIYD